MTDSSAPAHIGRRLLRAALWAVAAFVAAVGGWLAFAAATNPDVTLKRPRWVDGAFEHSFWLPVLLVTVGGALLVGIVMWTALSRLRSGEDLYAQRTGRGLRRRRERHLGDAPPSPHSQRAENSP